MHVDRQKVKIVIYLSCLFFTAILIRFAYAVEDTYFKNQKLEIPIREVSVIVSKEGFFPNRLVVFRGEKVRFFLTSTIGGAQCFNIPSYNLFVSPAQSKVAEAEVYFDRAGIFPVNCPNNSMNARVVVLERAEDRKESERRGRVGHPVHIWMPKETPVEWQNSNRGNTAFSSQGGDYIDIDSFNERNSESMDQEEGKNFNNIKNLPDSKSNNQIGVGRTLASE